ncbi:MAG: hypothetical protein JSV86_18335 [Gemmatimonadota bacterium]|nr:MAG: hypothetical protein JSV86_18335 [Gemmatimonadota bacterium]
MSNIQNTTTKNPAKRVELACAKTETVIKYCKVTQELYGYDRVVIDVQASAANACLVYSKLYNEWPTSVESKLITGHYEKEQEWLDQPGDY